MTVWLHGDGNPCTHEGTGCREKSHRMQPTDKETTMTDNTEFDGTLDGMPERPVRINITGAPSVAGHDLKVGDVLEITKARVIIRSVGEKHVTGADPAEAEPVASARIEEIVWAD